MDVQTEPHDATDEVTELKRRVAALEEAVRQLTEEVRRLYESHELS